MKALVFMSLVLIGCAGDKKQPAVACVADPFPFNYQYPDGQVLKSHKTDCSNGCTTISFINDDSVSQVVCN